MMVIRNLNSGYGTSQVLTDVNLTVNKGQIYGIVGPNGSGKSTLLKTIFGLTNIYGGTIEFNGTSLIGLPPHDVAKLGITYIPQVGNTFSNLKVKENLILSAYTITEEEKEGRVEEILETFPIVRESLDRKARTLSGGERQMLAMAMGLMRRPVLMMFDEPASNLAPQIALQVVEKIEELRTSGITVILVEQVVKKWLELSDEACLLVSGSVMYDGQSENLLQESELGRIYLGIGKSRTPQDEPSGN
jgi:branched-chain amino acid transport system ATP-binding protein